MKTKLIWKDFDWNIPFGDPHLERMLKSDSGEIRRGGSSVFCENTVFKILILNSIGNFLLLNEFSIG